LRHRTHSAYSRGRYRQLGVPETPGRQTNSRHHIWSILRPEQFFINHLPTMSAEHAIPCAGERKTMATQTFFETLKQDEDAVFAALEQAIRAAAVKARVRALNETAPESSASDSDRQLQLQKLDDDLQWRS
jgi:hypothetical protein